MRQKVNLNNFLLQEEMAMKESLLQLKNTKEFCNENGYEFSIIGDEVIINIDAKDTKKVIEF
jgi:hypothetical protein